MENELGAPTPPEAAAAIADAEARRAFLADHVVVPRLFFPAVGAAVAIQIGTTAAGVAGAGESPLWLLAAGFAVFLAVSAVQLARFRRRNGVWLGGMASRVIGGTATAASTSYVAALAAAVWSAFAGAWWLVALCAAAGGTGYALSGRSWMRKYRAEPATHSRGESALWLTVCLVLSLAGLFLLVFLG
jgi:membrane protein implicated in regulation of membrane protease activity